MLTLKSVDSQAKIFSQLPVHSYIDPHIFEVEKKAIFDKYPKYLGFLDSNRVAKITEMKTIQTTVKLFK